MFFQVHCFILCVASVTGVEVGEGSRRKGREYTGWAEVRPGKVFLAWFPHNIEGGALLGGILDSVHSKGDFFIIISVYSRCGKDFQSKGKLGPGLECFI